MIVYQLPNGKVVYLTLDQFLSMTDDDESLLNEQNYGRSTNSPFINIDDIKDDDIPDDDYRDLYNNDDEIEPNGPINLDHLFED